MNPAVPLSTVAAVWPRFVAEGMVTTHMFPTGSEDAARISGDVQLAMILRRDGTVWMSPSGQTSAPVHHRLAMAVVVEASRRWPELIAALPVRPAASVGCDVCEGRGRSPVPGSSKEGFCLRCDGLGWLEASGEPRSAFEAPPLPRFESVRALMEHDESSPLDWSELDDALWQMLVRRLETPELASRYPEPVVAYYASRYLQWEVGNGGFAQASYSIPEWFELAEHGYRVLGKERAAALIGEARAMLADGQEKPRRSGLLKLTIGQVFKHFERSPMARLDARTADCDWECDEDRVAFVRRHRDVFKLL